MDCVIWWVHQVCCGDNPCEIFRFLHSCHKQISWMQSQLAELLCPSEWWWWWCNVVENFTKIFDQNVKEIQKVCDTRQKLVILEKMIACKLSNQGNSATHCRPYHASIRVQSLLNDDLLADIVVHLFPSSVEETWSPGWSLLLPYRWLICLRIIWKI